LYSATIKVIDPTYQSAVTVALSQVANPAVRQVTTYYTSDEQSLVSKDQKSTYAVISLAGSEQEQQNAIEHLRPQFRSDALQIQLGGPAAVNEEIKHQIESDLAKIETFSFPILALLLLVVFRDFWIARGTWSPTSSGPTSASSTSATAIGSGGRSNCCSRSGSPTPI